ncbi:MAG: HAD family hydrolase [Bacteroidetes bacterium HGW-Bacteroidetes-21]|jgi:putative hydrolase of the HAD superfamily|nr:MAG: HAD family hydrolase [Bacteroidetes bacterium HGW-Bacteroidetes-21]
MNTSSIKVIAFDADDTLWVNEPYYQASEKKFEEILSTYAPGCEARKELVKTDIQNVDIYGYGVKGFVLSMIETALRLTDHNIPQPVIHDLINLGKDMLQMPIELLDGVEATLNNLKGRYRLILATKGDLLDQQRKLKKSGLIDCFDHIEIMSDKQEADYTDLLRRLKILPEQFMMIGNSIKSDILPVLAIGGLAVHIPYHVLWEHEKVEKPASSDRFAEVATIEDVLTLL